MMFNWRFVTKLTLMAALLMMGTHGYAQTGEYPTYPTVNAGTRDQAEVVKRGEYLAKMGDCLSCHTVTPGGKAYAGGLPFATPFGTFYSPNITSDKTTGIGNWTFEDFKRAMHDGKNPKGQNYFPVFPYLYFTQITDQDLRALWAYFQVVPAVKSENKKNAVHFPFSWRFGQYAWKTLFFYRYQDTYKYDPNNSPQWNRGKYLVDGLGHCGMCHTPLNFLGAPKRDDYLTGAFVEGYWATNITGPGLRSGDIIQVADVFKQHQLLNEAGSVVGPMAEVIHNSLSLINKDDRVAIATYLKSVHSSQPLGLDPLHRMPTLARGRVVYQRSCVVCHQNGEQSAPIIGNSGSWFERAKKGKKSLYEHVLYGFNLMPIKGACVTCSTEDIEAATDYILAKSLTHAQALAVERGDVAKPTPPDGKEVYQRSCASCHDKGEQGAPKIGDTRVWESLIEKNMDILIRQTTSGSHGGVLSMSCPLCTTGEVIAATKYILKESKVKGDYSLW